MVLHEEQPLLESLDFCLQLQPSGIAVISDLAESTDVAHGLVHAQLRLTLDSEVIVVSSKMATVHRICKDLSP